MHDMTPQNLAIAMGGTAAPVTASTAVDEEITVFAGAVTPLAKLAPTITGVKSKDGDTAPDRVNSTPYLVGDLRTRRGQRALLQGHRGRHLGQHRANVYHGRDHVHRRYRHGPGHGPDRLPAGWHPFHDHAGRRACARFGQLWRHFRHRRHPGAGQLQLHRAARGAGGRVGQRRVGAVFRGRQRDAVRAKSAAGFIAPNSAPRRSSTWSGPIRAGCRSPERRWSTAPSPTRPHPRPITWSWRIWRHERYRRPGHPVPGPRADHRRAPGDHQRADAAPVVGPAGAHAAGHRRAVAALRAPGRGRGQRHRAGRPGRASGRHPAAVGPVHGRAGGLAGGPAGTRGHAAAAGVRVGARPFFVRPLELRCQAQAQTAALAAARNLANCSPASSATGTIKPH